MAKIFVTGHKGMVGSAIIDRLSRLNKIYTTDKKKLNFLNQKQTLNYFKKNRFDQIYMCAAKVGGIHANSKYSADFIYENLQIQNNCIHAAYKTNVKKILFLGSTCIYPKKSKIPIKESYLLSGKLEETNDAYAIAKIAGIKMCESYNRQYGRKYISLMPTNTFGPGDNYNLENSHFIPAILRKLYEAKINNKKYINLWGTGKPKREIIYVDDLAEAIIFFLKKK